MMADSPSVEVPLDSRDNYPIRRDPKTGKLQFPQRWTQMRPRPTTQKDTSTEDIRRLIKERVRRKTEARRKDTETGSDSLRSDEKPLPKRAPRSKPRVIGNVQVAPPRPDGNNEATSSKETQDRTHAGEDSENRTNTNEKWERVQQTRRRGTKSTTKRAVE